MILRLPRHQRQLIMVRVITEFASVPKATKLGHRRQGRLIMVRVNLDLTVEVCLGRCLLHRQGTSGRKSYLMPMTTSMGVVSLLKVSVGSWSTLDMQATLGRPRWSPSRDWSDTCPPPFGHFFPPWCLPGPIKIVSTRLGVTTE